MKIENFMVLFYANICYAGSSYKLHENMTKVFIDVIKGVPSGDLNIIFDNHTDKDFVDNLQNSLQKEMISTRLFNVTNIENQKKLFNLLLKEMNSYQKTHCLFLCTHQMSEYILLKLQNDKLIHRNMMYIFYWGQKPIKRRFIRSLHEDMSTVVITNPKNGTYYLLYNQATVHRKHHLSLVNWWTLAGGLFHLPTLPSAINTYKNFNGKILKVPVLHKPPWHFVRYNNDSIEVYGGRDKKLLNVLANKLNFRFLYFNPFNFGANSNKTDSVSFQSAIELIKEKEADIFLGDVTLSWEHNKIVDFTFFTLADSGAFITHTPSRLSETLALVRPFQKQVWPIIIIAVLISGPVLFFLVLIPNLYNHQNYVNSYSDMFGRCTWFSLTIFLKQTGKEPISSNKLRFLSIILSISATYVLSDMYSANLTSLLAKPGRESPVNSLFQLETAIREQQYNLLIDQHSSLYSIVQNGTGIYSKLWNLMIKQPKFITDSVESGVKLIKNSKKNVLMAGRETLFYDIQRFGSNHFHLSEKLNTAYSAIALQPGCPYIMNIDKILMTLFEAGIVTKMTEDEYNNLGKEEINKEFANTDSSDTFSSNGIKIKDENNKLEPINIQMLQGAFYVLTFGHVISSFIYLIELMMNKYFKKIKITTIIYNYLYKRFKYYIGEKINFMSTKIKQKYQKIKHDMYVSTLDYID